MNTYEHMVGAPLRQVHVQRALKGTNDPSPKASSQLNLHPHAWPCQAPQPKMLQNMYSIAIARALFVSLSVTFSHSMMRW